jgi:hypothetical protein
MHRDSVHHAAVPATGIGTASTAFARAWPALPAICVLVVIFLLLAFNDGGYFPSSFTAAGAAAFLALAVLLAASPARARFSTNALLALGALAGFAAWIGLSSQWSTAADTPLLDMQRALLYLALFALALVAADSRLHARMLVWSVLVALLAIVVVGLLSRLQPDIVTGTTDPFSKPAYRLQYPLEYWNTFGALASLGAVLALGLAADRHSPSILRASAAAAATLLSVAMYFSLSRGAWLALILGVVVLLALAPNRGSLLISLAIVGGAVALLVLRLRSYPALVTNPAAGTGQAAQGSAFTGELVFASVVVLIAQGLLAEERVAPELRRHARSLRKPALIAAGAIVAVVALGGYALQGARAEAKVKDATAWVDKQWNDFLQTTAQSGGAGTGRLLSARGARSAGYRVAIDGFEAHPLRGEGAGSFEVRWMQDRDLDVTIRDAHSLPLETLDELGIVGLLLLLGFVGAVAAAARRCLTGRGGIRPAEAAAVTAAFVVWLGHSSVDWDWEMPALTAPALIISATLCQRGRKRRGSPQSPASTTRSNA